MISTLSTGDQIPLIVTQISVSPVVTGSSIFTEDLEYLVQVHGVETLQKYDLGRGIDGVGGPSLTVSIGAYLLSQGKNELRL